MNAHLSGPPAGTSLWERISSDPDYLRARRQLQAQYGLPLSFDIRLEHEQWLAWLGAGEKPASQRAKRGRAFLKDVHSLFKKFEVPDAWHADFMADLAGVSSDDLFEGLSVPRFNLSIDSAGRWKWECIITPETDLTNPLILKMIQRAQKEYAGDPPRPSKQHSRSRKLDWRPVYEWHQKHPLFTVEAIAEKINYAPQTVRRGLAEFEKSSGGNLSTKTD